jgi:CRP-like cAMP-binding protein
MDSMGEYLQIVSVITIVLACLFKKLLWLRIMLNVSAIICLAIAFKAGENALASGIILILIINSIQIATLLLDQISITQPEQTRDIYQRYFSIMTTREFGKLIKTNAFNTVYGTILTREAEVPDKLYLILKGEVEIVKSEQTITTLRAGAFIGEMSFISKGSASASSRAVKEVQCAFWTRDDLDRLKQQDLTIYNKFLSIIGCDLVNKLNQGNQTQRPTELEVDFVI